MVLALIVIGFLLLFLVGMAVFAAISELPEFLKKYYELKRMIRAERERDRRERNQPTP